MTAVPNVPGHRSPFEAFLLLVSLVAVLPLLQGDPGSAALEAALNDGTIIVWGLALGAGSTLALTGLWWRGGIWASWLLERAGLMLVCVAALVYGAVIVEAAGSVDEIRYAAAVQTGYSAACAWRCWQITRDMRRAREAMAH